MRRVLILTVAVLIFMSVPAFAADDMAAKLNAVLLKGPAEGNWQVKPADVAQWIKEGKKDFLVVDVRPNPAEYPQGHIPGSIYIPYNEILKPDNLAKLPKDKKVVLVCVTGQTQNLPVVALRALGYDARTMQFGYAAWIKGYFGAKLMQDAINAAATANYPLVK